MLVLLVWKLCLLCAADHWGKLVVDDVERSMAQALALLAGVQQLCAVDRDCRQQHWAMVVVGGECEVGLLAQFHRISPVLVLAVPRKHHGLSSSTD